MKINSPLATAAAFVLLSLPTAALAGEAEDVAGVKAASDSFYTALGVLGDGREMMAVFADAPYVTMVGPRSKDIITGTEALGNYWKASNKMFVVRDAKITHAQIHVAGNAAWEVGLESSPTRFRQWQRWNIRVDRHQCLRETG